MRIQFADRLSLNPNFVNWIDTLTEAAIEKRFSTARQALEALKSGQVLSQKSRSSAIGKIPQPSGDRFKINTSAEQLEIQFSNNRTGLAGMVVVYAFIWICLWIIFWLGNFFVLIFFLFCFGLPIVLANFYFIIMVVFVLGERFILRFNRDAFEIKRQLFGFDCGLQKCLLADIVGIFLNQIDCNYQVIIRSENRSYKIGENLTELESCWLAQEIQDWLNY